MESNTKKHQFLPDPVQELNGNICRLCDLLEILLDSEAKEIKVQRKIKDEKKELSELYQKVIS
jgi:vacuolar-type H+-ATPase subunit I/STV1